MEYFGYSCDEVIKIIEKRERIDQSTLFFCLAVLDNLRRIKKSRAQGKPDMVKNYKGIALPRKNTGEQDDLYAISLGGKSLVNLYYNIPQAVRTKGAGELRQNMKKLFQRNMKKHNKVIKQTFKKIIENTSTVKRYGIIKS